MGQAGEPRVRSLARLARAVCGNGPLLELIELTAEEARATVPAASVSISRLEPGVGQVRTLVNVGRLGPTEERWPENETYEFGSLGYLFGLVESARPWRSAVDDPDGDPQEQQLLVELDKGSAVGRPVLAGEQVWGELYLTREVGEPPVPEEAMDYLDALTSILGVALLRAQREEALTRLAFHDALTGLPNRRALDEQAALAFDAPEGVVRVATAVVVDINGLKQVNDTQGHGAGDQLISAVGSSLQTCFSRLPGSFVARVGGDEFVVLVVGHPPELVRQVADELCGLTWTSGAAAAVSCGAASLELAAGTAHRPTDLFAAADRAQYVAKRSRLRHTVLAGALDRTPPGPRQHPLPAPQPADQPLADRAG